MSIFSLIEAKKNNFNRGRRSSLNETIGTNLALSDWYQKFREQNTNPLLFLRECVQCNNNSMKKYTVETQAITNENY